jgi:predicted ArsR family transcriptional regulator
MTTKHAHSARTVILDLLADGRGLTTQQITEATKLKATTVSGTLKVMRREKEVYVDHWEQTGSGRKDRAVWMSGDLDDAELERPIAPADMSAIAKLREFSQRLAVGPFATAMWNVAQGAR